MLTSLYGRLSRDEGGASMVEYALLVVLIALVAFVAVQLAGDTLSETYSEIADHIAEA
jgi:Flp pilus assembly pilin Flp